MPTLGPILLLLLSLIVVVARLRVETAIDLLLPRLGINRIGKLSTVLTTSSLSLLRASASLMLVTNSPIVTTFLNIIVKSLCLLKVLSLNFFILESVLRIYRSYPLLEVVSTSFTRSYLNPKLLTTILYER